MGILMGINESLVAEYAPSGIRICGYRQIYGLCDITICVTFKSWKSVVPIIR